MSKKITALFTFSIFWLVAFLCYFKTAGAGFVTDEVGWLQTYKSMGWHGIFHAFGDKSLHYGYHLCGFMLWKLFGLNGYAWMLVFVSLHAAIATVSFLVFSELFLAAEISAARSIAFAGSLLFLISPYQTEPMVWYACIHYLVCSLLLLLAFQFLLFYLRSCSKKFIGVFYVCFFFSLFTIEISLIFPILLLIFFLFWPAKIFKRVERFKAIRIFFLPSFASLVVYFLLSKFLRGSVVGHYGAAQHLNFNILLLMGNLSKYVSKIFFLAQFFSFEHRSSLYRFFEKVKFGWMLFCALSIFVVLYLLFSSKLKSKFKIMILLFAFFVVALLPILNLYFSYLVNVEGDRFTYFASVFAYQFIAFACTIVFRKFGWLLLAIFFYLNVKFLAVNTGNWSQSKQVQQSLIPKFKWYDAPQIYLLNLPDNFHGTYMFRSFPPDNFFARTLTIRTGKNIENKVVGIYNYNMESVSDAVEVEKISDNQLKVTFAQGGNWWWSNGVGASDYSTENYEAKVDGVTNSYTVTFKNKVPGTVYLYQCGGDWREVKDF